MNSPEWYCSIPKKIACIRCCLFFWCLRYTPFLDQPRGRNPPSDGAMVWSKGFAGAPEPASSGFASLFDPQKRRPSVEQNPGLGTQTLVELKSTSFQIFFLLGKEQTASGTSRQRPKNWVWNLFPDDFFARGIAVFFSGQVLCPLTQNQGEERYLICDIFYGERWEKHHLPRTNRRDMRLLHKVCGLYTCFNHWFDEVEIFHGEQTVPNVCGWLLVVFKTCKFIWVSRTGLPQNMWCFVDIFLLLESKSPSLLFSWPILHLDLFEKKLSGDCLLIRFYPML